MIKNYIFSWQVDETTDVTCCLSIILRYVVDGDVVERFGEFYFMM
jgi:hypothetical protein